MKRGINFKMSNTVFRVSFVVLCLRINTQMVSKRLHLPGVKMTAREFHRQKKFHSLLKQCGRIVFYLYDMNHHTLEIVLKDRKLFRKA